MRRVVATTLLVAAVVGCIGTARKRSSALAAALLLGGCGLFAQPAVPPPFCAPMDGLGSVQLDYDAPQATPSVSRAEAEAIARSSMGIPASASTCSVRLARYRNLEVTVDAVWVVHLDGLHIESLGGPLPLDGGAPPSPRYLRRGLAIVTAEAPPKMLISVLAGP